MRQFQRSTCQQGVDVSLLGDRRGRIYKSATFDSSISLVKREAQWNRKKKCDVVPCNIMCCLPFSIVDSFFCPENSDFWPEAACINLRQAVSRRTGEPKISQPFSTRVAKRQYEHMRGKCSQCRCQPYRPPRIEQIFCHWSDQKSGLTCGVDFAVVRKLFTALVSKKILFARTFLPTEFLSFRSAHTVQALLTGLWKSDRSVFHFICKSKAQYEYVHLRCTRPSSTDQPSCFSTLDWSFALHTETAGSLRRSAAVHHHDLQLVTCVYLTETSNWNTAKRSFPANTVFALRWRGVSMLSLLAIPRQINGSPYPQAQLLRRFYAGAV